MLACGAAPSVIVPVRAQAALDAAAIASFDLWVFDQVGKDGQPLRCEDLLTRALSAASENVVVVAHLRAEEGTPAVFEDLPVGQKNLIFYVDVFNRPGALGERLGAGCTPSVSIVGATRVRVEIAIADPPPITSP